MMGVPDVIYTSNPIHDYEFSWTIENFSHTPDVLRGPSIPPMPGFPGLLEKLCLELEFKEKHPTLNQKGFLYNFLNVSLIQLFTTNRNLIVSSCTSFRSTNDKIIKKATVSSTAFNGRTSLLYYSSGTSGYPDKKLELSKQMNLVEDKLVVEGKLSFSGYHIMSSGSSQLVKNNSENCVELLKDFKTMYESGLASDITFSIGEQTLRAHKNILLGRSPVLAKMFDSDMVESNSNNVAIEDSDVHAFNCFLVFLYTGIVEDQKLDTVLSLYYLAHKYQVKSLHSTCSAILGRSMAIDSVCRILMLSDLHGDKELKDVVKVFIRHHIIQIAGTTEWVELATTKPQLVTEVLA